MGFAAGHVGRHNPPGCRRFAEAGRSTRQRGTGYAAPPGRAADHAQPQCAGAAGGRRGPGAARSEGWPLGRATSTWEVGDVWPDGHTFAIPAAAASGPYRAEVSFYDPATLALLGDAATVGHVVIGAPAGANGEGPALAQFGDSIALAQADVPQAGWQAGTTQAVDLTWLAQAPTRGRYTVFLQLIGPAGSPVAQGDQEPWQGTYPTEAWLAARARHRSLSPRAAPRPARWRVYADHGSIRPHDAAAPPPAARQ